MQVYDPSLVGRRIMAMKQGHSRALLHRAVVACMFGILPHSCDVVCQLKLYPSTGLATSIFGVLEAVRIRPNLTLYRIRPNPEPISLGSKCSYRMSDSADKITYGATRNPPESARIRPSTESVRIPNRHPSPWTKALRQQYSAGLLGIRWASVQAWASTRPPITST